MRASWVLVALVCVLSPGCAQSQCEALSDCAPNEICAGGLCESGTGGMTRLDAGIRRDAGGFRDAAVEMDAGRVDSGGSLDQDAGPAIDAGPVDSCVGSLPIEGNIGFVWVGELLISPQDSAYHAFALLQRLDAATFTRRKSAFADDEGTSCQLCTRRLTGGTVTGFEADSISVIPGPTPFSLFSMYPVGNGRFEPDQNPVERLYSESVTAYFQIYGTGVDGSVESGLVGVTAPPYVFEDVAFSRGRTLAIVPSPRLLWSSSDLSDGKITIELFDRVREVVLSCRIADDGTYTIPDNAISAFLGEQPMPPVHLEIRYDRETTNDATIRGTGLLSVTYRASLGLRYPVNLP